MAAAKTISCRVLSQCPKAGPQAGPQLLRISTTHALVTATVPAALTCPGTSTPETAHVRQCSCIALSPINRSLKIKCKKNKNTPPHNFSSTALLMRKVHKSLDPCKLCLFLDAHQAPPKRMRCPGTSEHRGLQPLAHGPAEVHSP